MPTITMQYPNIVVMRVEDVLRNYCTKVLPSSQPTLAAIPNQSTHKLIVRTHLYSLSSKKKGTQRAILKARHNKFVFNLKIYVHVQLPQSCSQAPASL